MNYMRVQVKFLQIFKTSSSEDFEVYENKMILTLVVAFYRRKFYERFCCCDLKIKDVSCSFIALLKHILYCKMS